MRNKSKFYVIIFGEPEGEDLRGIGGEIIEFDLQKELDAWLTVNQIRLHEKVQAAKDSFLQLEDGRAAVIIRGNRKVIKTQVLMA